MHTAWRHSKGDVIGPLPLPNYLSEPLLECDPAMLNFSLLFHRYLPEIRKDESEHIRLLTDAFHGYIRTNAELVKQMREQQQAAVAAVSASPALEVVIELRERLVIGLGLPSPLESGMRLHHLIGVPYVPSSALKGLARATGLQELATAYGVAFLINGPTTSQPSPVALLEELAGWHLANEDAALPAAVNALRHILARLAGQTVWPAESRAAAYAAQLQGCLQMIDTPADFRHIWPEVRDAFPEVAAFRDTFGSTDMRGGAIFSDAYPLNLDRLEPDIINPHYVSYYANPENVAVAPADYHDPIPTFFLAIPARTRFTCTLGRLRDAPPTAKAARPKVVDWLDAGLRTWGIGAKTAVGYGAAAVTRP